MIAGRAVRTIGVLYLLAAGFSLYALIDDLNHRSPAALMISRISDLPSFVLEIFTREEPFPIAIILLAVFSALQWGLAKGINRGRKWACLIGAITAVPLGLLLLTITFVFSAIVVVGILPYEGTPSQPWTLLYLIPALLGMVLFLLLKDLIAYLLWITKNPVTEKHPVSFLTGKEKP